MKFEEYIDSLFEKGIMPGASVLVGEEERIKFYQNRGNIALFPEKRSIVSNPVYDLASLTKPFITSLLTLYLTDSGELTLKTPVYSFFSGFHKEMTIRNLLTHTSGLPSWLPLYLQGDDYLKSLERTELNSRPGKKVVYSCMGYILLGFILEKIFNRTLDIVSRSNIFDPLGMKDSFFFKKAGVGVESIAPTERGNGYEKELVKNLFPGMDEGFKWRENIIHGEVNDGNAFYLGRAAGNAGLFSTAKDIFILSREFFPETASILKPETVELFWKNLTPFKRSFRSAGFKINLSPVTSGGRSLSPRAIGHNGFTGTSVWMEKKRRRVYIILTNRIHPEVDKSVNFNRVRRKIHRLLKSEYL